MEENLNIFGKNLGEIGSLDKNLVLRTKGKVYIRYGRKYIDLLDSLGNLNVKVPKVLSKITSKDEIKSNGFYILDGNLYAYVDGETIQITGTEGSFISYAIELDLTQEQIEIVLKNIGLKFNSIDEATKVVNDGIVFIGSDMYYINNGTYTKIGLQGPLESINNSGLAAVPDLDNQCIAYLNGQWVYTPLITDGDLQNLKTEILLEIDDGGEYVEEPEGIDPIQYSKVYKITDGDLTDTGIEELDTIPSFSLSVNDIAILSFNALEVLEHRDIQTDYGTVVGLKAGNDTVITLNLKVIDGETLTYITETGATLNVLADSGYMFTDSIPTTIDDGEEVDYLIINGTYYILKGDFSINNKNLYIKAESSKKEKFKIDYANAEIAIEENYPNPLQVNQHVVLGNVKNFSVYKDRGDLGLYSDNPVFVGGEFKGNDNFKEYPRYTKALNTTLCNNHSLIVDGNDFENVIPTIKWIKLNTPVNAFVSVEYLSSSKKINFKNLAGTIVGTVDATDFIKDGMVDNVTISENNLVISFNTDSGKEDITIPLTNIFNPNNYYTKSQVDSAISTATNDMATQTWVNNLGFLKTHLSLTNYYKKSETYSKTEVDNLISSSGGDSMPVGSIIMFGKSIDQIPSGWHICDGTNGTPDLTDRFIVGVGNSYSLGDTGGVRQNTIDGTNIPQHYHNVSDYYLFDSNSSLASANIPGKSTGKGGLVLTTGGTYHGAHESDEDNNTWAYITHLTSGTVDFSGNPINYDAGSNLALDNRPPYYALYYIMKIS